MLIQPNEYRQVLAPLLSDADHEPQDAFALAAFSKLCEPGDGLAGLLMEQLSPSALLQQVIARSQSQVIADLLGPDSVAQFEDKFESTWDEIWQNAMQRWQPRLSRKELIASLGWLASQKPAARGSLVLRDADDYPMGFLDLGAHRPYALWCLGDPQLLASPNILGIVGSRQVSRYGADVTRDIAAVAGQSGLVTVSGGAFGVDALVHESALALGAKTVAVMAGGLGHLYPRSNLQLLQRVAEEGLIFTESVPEVTPAKFRFLQRNRLIAALGQATVIVEAGATSGALSTGNHAISLGREVAVVPGPIDSAYSIGCHDFLNRWLGSVQLLARPQQILELAGLGLQVPLQLESLGRLEKRALDAFGHRALEAWEVQRLSGLTVKENQIALGSLELLGLIERVGTSYSRV